MPRLSALEKRIKNDQSHKNAMIKYLANPENKNKMRERSRQSMRKKRGSVKSYSAHCICCHVFIGNGLYCAECKKLTYEILKRETAIDSIAVSDFIFTTDLCDMNCDGCMYDDCILPVDEY